MSSGNTRDPLKVVVRLLPPLMPEEAFMETIQPEFKPFITWQGYRPGRRPNKIRGITGACSRCYFAFDTTAHAAEFMIAYHGHAFIDDKGEQFRAVATWAPFQRLPKKTNAEVQDPRAGTITSDPQYLEFVAELEARKAGEGKENMPHQEPEIEKMEITPLMQAILDKRGPRRGFGGRGKGQSTFGTGRKDMDSVRREKYTKKEIEKWDQEQKEWADWEKKQKEEWKKKRRQEKKAKGAKPSPPTSAAGQEWWDQEAKPKEETARQRERREKRERRERRAKKREEEAKAAGGDASQWWTQEGGAAAGGEKKKRESRRKKPKKSEITVSDWWSGVPTAEAAEKKKKKKEKTEDKVIWKRKVPTS